MKRLCAVSRCLKRQNALSAYLGAAMLSTCLFLFQLLALLLLLVLTKARYVEHSVKDVSSDTLLNDSVKWWQMELRTLSLP